MAHGAMQHDDDDPDATLERERLSVTKIYWKPEPPKVVVESGLVRAARALTPPRPAPVAPPPAAMLPTMPAPALPPTIQAPALLPPGWVVAPPPMPTMPPPMERTHSVRRMPRTVVRLAFGAVCVLLGIAIGSVIVFGNRSGAKATAAAATPAPAVTPAPPPPPPPPVAKPAPAPIVQPARIAVRIDSEPTGALTTLVDDGKAISLGPTPVETQLDPAKHYEVVLSLEDHKTNVQVIDPSKDQHLVVVLAPDAKPEARKKHVKRAKPVETDDDDGGPAARQGMLKVTSKPPCAIIVDGKPTGLTTPQTSLPLSVGKHEITLTNVDEGIHLTTSVDITADSPALLIKDFTK